MTALPIAEVFFSNYEDREPTQGPGNTWHGAWPYLDTEDGSASYGRHIEDFISYPWIGAHFAPAVVPAVTGMTVTVQARPLGGNAELDILIGSLDLSTSIYFGTRAIAGESPLPQGVWTTRAWTLTDGQRGPRGEADLAFDAATFSSLAAAGQLMGIVNMGVLAEDSFECSLIRVDLHGGPTFIPLRQFHRDDGHGMTPPRAFGGASRIRTGRAYGYD